jgi:hypothetical protein
MTIAISHDSYNNNLYTVMYETADNFLDRVSAFRHSI